jgi:hypothetical protein
MSSTNAAEEPRSSAGNDSIYGSVIRTRLLRNHMSQTPDPISPLTQAFKQRVFEHYGLYCHHPDGCDITDINDLCLDHVHENGSQQRAQGLRGIRLYKYILGMAKSDTPVWDDYTLLCYTHNHGKQIRRYATQRLESIPTTHSTKHLGPHPRMSEGRLQINSAVSQEVYSYIKTQKAERNIPEKQILQEMYESHMKGHMSGHESLAKLTSYCEQQFAKLHERLNAQRELLMTQCPEKPAASDDSPHDPSTVTANGITYPARFAHRIVRVHTPTPLPAPAVEKCSWWRGLMRVFAW